MLVLMFVVVGRAVTVADFSHHGGNGPTTAGGAVLCVCMCMCMYMYVYIYIF